MSAIRMMVVAASLSLAMLSAASANEGPPHRFRHHHHQRHHYHHHYHHQYHHQYYRHHHHRHHHRFGNCIVTPFFVFCD